VTPHIRLRARYRAILAVALATAAVLGAHRSLIAHAALLSAEPRAGSVLAHPPLRIRLVFSEPIDATVSAIRLVSAGAPPRDLAVHADPRDVSALLGATDSLPPGEYRVEWRTVSADGHKVSGHFAFTVAADTAKHVFAAPPPPMAEDTVPTTATLVGAPAVAAPLRGFAIACIMALAGLLFFSLRAHVNTRRATQLSFWLAIAALFLVAAHYLAWTVNTAPDHRFGLAWMRAVSGTSPGHMEIARLVLVALAAVACVVARRPLPTFLFAVAALFASAAIGHPAAIHPLVAIPMNAVHLCAGAAWLGGLLWLIAAERDDVSGYAVEARRVSSVALAAVILVVLTGVAQTLTFSGALLDIVHLTYGKVVIVKVIGVLVLVCFGAYHRFKVLPQLSDAAAGARLRDSVRLEVAVFVLVVLFGGLLAYLPPHGSEMTMTDMHAPHEQEVRIP
jgi:copper transport protein